MGSAQEQASPLAPGELLEGFSHIKPDNNSRPAGKNCEIFVASPSYPDGGGASDYEHAKSRNRIYSGSVNCAAARRNLRAARRELLHDSNPS